MEPGLRRLVDAAVAIDVPPLPPPWPAEGQSRDEWAAAVAALREQHDQAGAARAERVAAEHGTPAPPPVARASEVTMPVDGDTITARVYVPEGTPPFPALVVFHGGGFWIGGGKAGMDAADVPSRTLCSALGSVIVNVDYRMAPEHRFPVPLEDCYSAARWVADNSDALEVDRNRISVAGASAGGNLAVGVALLARERRGPSLRFQLLLVPAVDPSMSFPSVTENGSGTEITADTLATVWDYYFGPDGDRAHPHAALLNADLAGLPPAHIVVAEFDPLRDEGIALAEQLREADVPVTRGRYHMTHAIAEPGVAGEYLSDAIAAVDRANRS